MVDLRLKAYSVLGSDSYKDVFTMSERIEVVSKAKEETLELLINNSDSFSANRLKFLRQQYDIPTMICYFQVYDKENSSDSLSQLYLALNYRDADEIKAVNEFQFNS